jgi:F420-dependent oxidoreductase-like protein
MKLSLSMTNYSWPGDALALRLAEVALAADEAGLDTVWVSDHLLQADPTSTLDAEMLEAYTTLGYLAALTHRVKLGAMVSAATYRAPSLLIKIVTTLDVLSGGRAWLGIGAGYHEEEARAMGLSLPPTRARYEQLEETLALALRMWGGDITPFTGHHHRLEQPLLSPPPITRPHPPILIGGMGERQTLRLVARFGDACNLFDIADGGETIRRKLAVLADHCRRLDRPCTEIEKTVSMRLKGGESAEAFVMRCRALAALGIEHAVVITDHAWVDGDLATLADAAAELRDVSPALQNRHRTYVRAGDAPFETKGGL